MKQTKAKKKKKKEGLEELYSNFSPEIVRLLPKADTSSLGFHIRLDRPALKTWANGRVASLSDTEHPFLPCTTPSF